MTFFENLKKISKTAVKNESMKKHTSFKIGGNADFMVFPETVDEIKKIIELCNKNDVPFMIMGNGSNMLVSDEGIKGVVVKISTQMSKIKITGETVYAEAGVLLSTLSKYVLEESVSGLEFASGIPGTLGGAIVMNAGAYGGEMKDVIEKIGYMDIHGNVHEISCDEAQLGYRTSVFSNSEDIILYSVLKLTKGNKTEILNTMNDLNSRRKEKQPLHLPSAGSTFKRPEGYFAGKLIEDCGLKGYTVGGAAVSEKHSGFVVNINNATANDVKELISDVQEKVYEKFGVKLEREVKYYGRE